MEIDLRTMYNENKQDVSRIGKGIEYLQNVPNSIVSYKHMIQEAFAESPPASSWLYNSTSQH